MCDRRKVDADHLQLLAVFHFVLAGFAVAGLAFLGLHYALMHAFLTNPAMLANQKGGGPPPQAFFAIFKWFYVIFGIMLVIAALGNLLSGLFIKKRKHRTFSLIVAGLDILQIPFGTVLGVFTLVVLLRESVLEIYSASSSA